jgi:prepilin-type N-terminal cleavage/methylation domain-containing protein
MKPKLGEKGFTLIELLVGLSIAAFVVGAASMTTITMIRLTPQTNNWAIALHQVQNAGHWISHDVQMSENVTVDENPATPEFLTLIVPEWDEVSETVVNRTIIYDFEDMPDGLKKLMRTDQDTGEQILIAEFISYTEADYSENCTDNCTLTFTITATSGDVDVTRDYEAMQRVPTP